MGLSDQEYKEVHKKLDTIISTQAAMNVRMENIEENQKNTDESVKELSKIVKGNGEKGLDTEIELLKVNSISWADIREKFTGPIITGGIFWFLFTVLPKIIERINGG